MKTNIQEREIMQFSESHNEVKKSFIFIIFGFALFASAVVGFNVLAIRERQQAAQAEGNFMSQKKAEIDKKYATQKAQFVSRCTGYGVTNSYTFECDQWLLSAEGKQAVAKAKAERETDPEYITRLAEADAKAARIWAECCSEEAKSKRENAGGTK